MSQSEKNKLKEKTVKFSTLTEDKGVGKGGGRWEGNHTCHNQSIHATVFSPGEIK